MKSYNIIKQAVIGGKNVVAEDVTVYASSIASALAGLQGARGRTPQRFKFLSRHSGISLFRDANGWLYMVNINP